MKKIVLLLSIITLLSTNVLALKPQIEILDEKAISKLSDENLLATYVDVVIEIEATKAFHNTSGFTPNDYKNFKRLLRYRIQILQEIHNRELEAPKVE